MILVLYFEMDCAVESSASLVIFESYSSKMLLNRNLVGGGKTSYFCIEDKFRRSQTNLRRHALCSQAQKIVRKRLGGKSRSGQLDDSKSILSYVG